MPDLIGHPGVKNWIPASAGMTTYTMELEVLSLAIPAFIAGILTFLAPCTLPLVPGYLGFISGVSAQDLQDPAKAHQAKRKIFLNGVLYVIGFSLVFIILGSLFGLGGAALAKYRIWLSRVGGIFVIFFGLYMLNVFSALGGSAFGGKLSKLFSFEKRLVPRSIKPGSPTASFLFGSSFAFGWTPCVGPILGSILLLSSSSGTVGQGALLLAIFSAGLAVPFLAIAAGIGRASNFLSRASKYLKAVSIIGGIFLIFLGILLVTNQFAAWLGYAYQLFDFIDYAKLLDYL